MNRATMTFLATTLTLGAASAHADSTADAEHARALQGGASAQVNAPAVASPGTLLGQAHMGKARGEANAATPAVPASSGMGATPALPGNPSAQEQVLDHRNSNVETNGRVNSTGAVNASDDANVNVSAKRRSAKHNTTRSKRSE